MADSLTPPERGHCDAGFKRLEEGSFDLPAADGQRATVGEHGLSLRPAELAMLLDGIDLGNVKRRKRYQRPQAAATANGSGK